MGQRCGASGLGRRIFAVFAGRHAIKFLKKPDIAAHIPIAYGLADMDNGLRRVGKHGERPGNAVII